MSAITVNRHSTPSQALALRDYVRAIWDEVLVPLCGASMHPHERDTFVFAHTEEPYPCHQYRFEGSFGFGGKLIMSSDHRSCVTYQGIDRTAELDRLQRAANQKLHEMWCALRSNRAQ